MEVGAVKQAFNNEIILLKKNLNQAKIQIIHKLTRKAKTFTEKKVPEPLKEKLKRKAESAVKEVLIIKKIKARDIARFIVTHTGKLNDYLNKPIVDNNKACARLLLHKALKHKYKHIRETFLDISIKDLFMSRQERRKLKKEAREKQKNKKKGKDKKDKSDAVNVEGEWDVEMTDDKNVTPRDDTIASDDDLRLGNDKSDGDSNKSDDEMDNSNEENDKSDTKSDDDGDEIEICDESEAEQSSDSDDSNKKVKNIDKRKPLVLKTNDSDIESSSEKSIELVTPKSKTGIPRKVKNSNSSKGTDKNGDLNDIENITSKVETTKTNLNKKDNLLNKINNSNSNKAVKKEDSSIVNVKNKKFDKKDNINKNKNLKHKLENRNFHKKIDETPNEATKMVDPFFITSTGENYMSLVEPRQPDEVKEVHRQGNRQYRRAVMFGHVPRAKPKRNFEPRNNNFNKNSSEMDNNKFNKNNKNFDKKENFNKKSDRSNFKDNSVPEKLHPSWEAKKKQSGILPYQGKKIVFDES
ncbi:MATH and LRR domain-containing protein PFE0570w [Maniola jurtina]|uniref:MATH and LRR domain-containing protein PFE0570w n=1 Tax=Maniola jurtina TaxID=191418 RepID=UPI001E68DD23|nr:MATH and LRR domain-containing protein PFE0570w [Maniola jurtina]